MTAREHPPPAWHELRHTPVYYGNDCTSSVSDVGHYIIRNLTPCSSETGRNFGGIYSPCLRGRRINQAQLPASCCLLVLLFEPEHGDRIFLRNIGWLADYVALYERRQFEHSPPVRLHIQRRTDFHMKSRLHNVELHSNYVSIFLILEPVSGRTYDLGSLQNCDRELQSHWG